MPTLSCSKKRKREIKILYIIKQNRKKKLMCATKTTKPIKKTKQRKVLVSFFFPSQILTHINRLVLVMVNQAPNQKKKVDGQLHSLSAADKTLCVQSSSTPLSRKLNCGECSGDLAIPEYDNDGESKDKDGRLDRGRTEEVPSKEG